MGVVKRRSATALVVVAALVALAGSAPADAQKRNPEGTWEVLGTRTVTDRVDHDRIDVTARRGTFRSLKVQVERRAVQFRDFKIHFGNGETQDVDIRDVIPAGGESRVIDIEGAGDRVIRSITFSYDAQAMRGRNAIVRVLGRN
jgi:hypothetical protein